METQKLIISCINGNSMAQKSLYKAYSAKMHGVCRRYIRDEQFAEDILVIGFTKVFSNLKQFENRGNFEGWMRRIFVNESLMHLRKNKARFNISSIDDDGFHVQIKNDSNIINDLSYKEILFLMEKLPIGYKTVFNLFLIEGYKHREIAELLDISINTSKSQLILAKKRMILLINENNK